MPTTPRQPPPAPSTAHQAAHPTGREGPAAPTIDLHAHFLPPSYLQDVRAGNGIDRVRMEVVDGVEWLVHRQGFRYPATPALYDLGARLARMDELGIDQAVVSIAPMQLHYWVRAAEAADFARVANDAAAQVAADSGGRLRATATLPMQDPDAAATELRRAVGDLGLVGAQIGPTIQGVPLDDAAVRPVLAQAQRLGAPLILHPYYVGPDPDPLLGDWYLTNLLGNPWQTTRAAARLILSGLLDDLDRLQVVLLHGGGALPYLIGRLDHGHHVRSEARDCRHPPSSYLRRFTYDTVTHEPAALDFLLSVVGPDRVAFGTDFPFDMSAGPLAEQVATIPLSPGDHALVAGGNAHRLLTPAPPPT